MSEPAGGDVSFPRSFQTQMADRFQVDLGGMVDLLSRHLYSGPQVYLRELLQNAVDAMTARGQPGRYASAPAYWHGT